MDPFFSVITVCRNAAPVLAATAESLRAQDFTDFEWIVVDGASTDDTCDIARRYLNLARDRLLSEPDDGLYFAMNKGLRMARGEVVQFLNAGDSYAAEDVLTRVHEAFTDAVDAVYGDTLLALADGRVVLRRAGDVGVMVRRRMPFSHQSLFVRRTLHLRHPFDESMRIAADYAVIASLHKAGARMLYLPEPLNVNTIEPEAVSFRGRAHSAAEDYHVHRRILGMSRFAATRRYLRKRAMIVATRNLQALPRWVFRRLPKRLRARIY